MDGLKEVYVLSKSSYILKSNMLEKIGIELPNDTGRNFCFESKNKLCYLVNTVDVYKTCKMLQNGSNRVFGLSGADYLADEGADIEIIQTFPFENRTFLAYIGRKDSKSLCTKFADNLVKATVEKYGLKNISRVQKVLGSEEVYLKMGYSTIASITSGKSINETLGFGLNNPSIEDVINELKNRDYDFFNLMECKTVFFKMPGE